MEHRVLNFGKGKQLGEQPQEPPEACGAGTEFSMLEAVKGQAELVRPSSPPGVFDPQWRPADDEVSEATVSSEESNRSAEVLPPECPGQVKVAEEAPAVPPLPELPSLQFLGVAEAGVLASCSWLHLDLVQPLLAEVVQSDGGQLGVWQPPDSRPLFPPGKEAAFTGLLKVKKGKVEETLMQVKRGKDASVSYSHLSHSQLASELLWHIYGKEQASGAPSSSDGPMS